MKTLFALLLSVSLFAADYDCIFIGSSPISLFEALYQNAAGKRVLIIDEAERCGGVWKSIDVCGVEHVDIGCHEIGSNKNLREFLEVYAGCQMVDTGGNNGFYFSQGCYELVHNLEKRLEKTNIDLWLNTRAERASIDETNKCARLQLGNRMVSADKVYLCGYSFLNIGNEELQIHKTKYFHLYLLVADPTPPRFGYQNGGAHNVSRMMNLTRFVGLENTGRQLIVFQTYEGNLGNGEEFLRELKKQKLLDESAYILKSEPYVYEQWPSHHTRGNPYFEHVQTYDIRNIVNNFTKWKELLKSYAEIFHQ